MRPPNDGSLSATGRLRLGAEILAIYARARWHLHRSDVTDTLAALRGGDGVPRCRGTIDPGILGRRLGRAAERTLRWLPADTRCLMQSLVLSGLLARRGIESKLVLAVRPGDEFAAHAWVEYAGRPLLDPGHPSFGRLVEI